MMKRLVIKWILIAISASTLSAVSRNGMKFGSNQTMVIISLLGAMVDEMDRPLAEAFRIPMKFLSVYLMSFVLDLLIIIISFALAKDSTITFFYAVIFALICALIGRICDAFVKQSSR